MDTSGVGSGVALIALTRQGRAIPHGRQFAAAMRAMILALYGRCDEAEEMLNAESWEDTPPFVRAQRSTATQESQLDLEVPGVRTSDLAFRTYRNGRLLRLDERDQVTPEKPGGPAHGTSVYGCRCPGARLHDSRLFRRPARRRRGL